MPKIESIRPGGTLEGSFEQYPLPDLLLGVLRGNLSGRLDVALSNEPRNHLYFKDGVPVSVHVPDLGVSVARILAEQGSLPRETVPHIHRAAGELKQGESGIILSERILPSGAVEEGRRLRAREELVRLFDVPDAGFCFVEGAPFDPSGLLTVLQPLPIVYEGLLKSSDRRVVSRIVAELGQGQLVLGPTFPLGVDPFEWGPEVDRAVGTLVEPRSLADLVRAGLDPTAAQAAIAALFLTGMVELHKEGRERPRSVADGPRTVELPPPRRVPRGEAPEAAEAESSGLVVYRRSSGAAERLRPASEAPRDDLEQATEPPPPIPRRARVRTDREPPLEHDRIYEEISSWLAPLRGKSYYKALRVSEPASLEQVERAHKALLRQLEEAGDGPGPRAMHDALDEAYHALVDAAEGPRYAAVVERAKTSARAVAERQALEAEPKVARALLSMAEGRPAEAAFLLDWASALDGGRRELKVYRAMLKYFRASRHQRPAEAHALRPLVGAELLRSPEEVGLKMCLALILAEEEDGEAAREVLSGLPAQAEHPLVRRARERLGGP